MYAPCSCQSLPAPSQHPAELLECYRPNSQLHVLDDIWTTCRCCGRQALQQGVASCGWVQPARHATPGMQLLWRGHGLAYLLNSTQHPPYLHPPYQHPALLQPYTTAS
jgi:hypothetical protein